MRPILSVLIPAVALCLAFNTVQAADTNNQASNNDYYQSVDRPYRGFDDHYGPRHHRHVQTRGYHDGYRHTPRYVNNYHYEDCPYYNDCYRNQSNGGNYYRHRPYQAYPDCPRTPRPPRGFDK